MHVQRRPFAGLNFSVERFFAAVRREMPEDIDTELYVVPFQSRGVMRRALDAAAVALRRADVVHVTGDIHFVALGLGKRSVLTVLDCGGPATGRAGRLVFRLLWLRLPARRAARVVAISAFTADELARLTGVRRGDIAVIPPPVDDAFQPQPPRRNDRPVVLCFAQTPNKNFDRVIDALRGMPVEVRVVGPMAESTASRLGSSGIKYVRGVSLSDAELLDWYAAADVVVFPSLYEGFGLPILEAQSVGRPVVTSDRAPMNEVAGGAACLVDPEDVEAIRAGVVRVLEDEEFARSLVVAGYANRERFRARATAEKYAEIYRELARTPTKR